MGRDSRIAMVRLGVEGSGYARDLARAEKATQTWGNRVKGHISKSQRGAFGGLGGITGLAGVAGFGAMAREVKVFNDRLVRLGISSNQSRGNMLKFNAALQATAVASGVSQDELLAGAEKYQELTGRLGEYTSQLSTFAQIQAATGAGLNDIATAAAALSDNLGVKPEEMLAAFDILTAQGKDGAVELKGLASELAGATGQFKQFGSGGTQAAAALGAWFQVLRKGTGSAAEAGTQLTNLMSALQNPVIVGKLEAAGIDVFANKETGQMRDLGEISKEITNAFPGANLADIFRDKEARAALVTYGQNLEMYDKLIDSQGKLGTTAKDAAIWQASAGGRLSKAQNTFTKVFNEALIKNLDAIVKAFEAMVKALAWIGDHPEALIAIAALWKGGGFVGGLGALGGAGAAAGGAGGGMRGALAGSVYGGGAANVARGARGARFASSAGGAMQGMAIGYGLSQVGERLSDTGSKLDTLSAAGMTAAGGLMMLGGPLGILGGIIMGLKVASDFMIHGIEQEQQKILAADVAGGAYAAGRAKSLGTTANLGGQVDSNLGLAEYSMAGVIDQVTNAGVMTEQKRKDAKFFNDAAQRLGFLSDAGLDNTKMEKFLSQQPEDTRGAVRSGFIGAADAAKRDPSLMPEVKIKVTLDPGMRMVSDADASRR